MAASITLDHTGIFAENLQEISVLYESLGFLLTPLSQHSGTYGAGQPLVHRGTANRCAMFRQGYLELLAVVDSALDTNGVPEALARYAGVHILAFGCADPEAQVARLQAAGYAVTRTHLERQVLVDGQSGLAQFNQIRVPAQALPETRTFMLQHVTPQRLWQPAYLDHPNGVQALLSLAMVVPDLPQAVTRYQRYLGQPCATHEADRGHVRLSLAQGALDLYDEKTFLQRFPDVVPPCLPFPALMNFGVADLAQTAAYLHARGIPVTGSTGQGYLRVPADLAGGAALQFLPL